jgi:hypothetical protein
MSDTLYSLRDASEVLKVRPYQIVYLLTTKQVPEPARLGGRRIFTFGDLSAIADKLELPLESDRERKANEN